MAETPIELGFAEFAGQLIAEVFEAVTGARAEQARKLAEMRALADADPSAEATRLVGDDEVEAELVRLFPPPAEGFVHGAQRNAPYRPAGGAVEEEPPFARLLGVGLQRADYVVGRLTKRVLLRASAAAKIERAARVRLAEARIAVLRELLREGLPRVVVDSGRVNAKLTFTVKDVRGQADGARQTGAPPLKSLPQLSGTAAAAAYRNLRLVVRQADPAAPQSSTVTANVFGEVEITFKTVV